MNNKVQLDEVHAGDGGEVVGVLKFYNNMYSFKGQFDRIALIHNTSTL